jgi:hypothetical protein
MNERPPNKEPELTENSAPQAMRASHIHGEIKGHKPHASKPEVGDILHLGVNPSPREKQRHGPASR